MVAQRRDAEPHDTPRERRRLSRAQRAIAWILALAIAVFVISYVTSPKEGAGGDRSDLVERGAMQNRAAP